jgi:hypothetical protein
MVDGHPLELRVLLKGGNGSRHGYKHWAETPAQAEQIVQKQLERPGVLYYGALPRAQKNSTDLVAGRVLWVDCDDPDAVKALNDFKPPNAVIESGSVTDGVPNVQALWFLDQLAAPEEITLGCRTLAHALGADMASAEAARILKVPGSRSDKPGGRVARIVRLSKAPYRLARLTAGLQPPVDLTGRTDRPNGRPMPKGSLAALFQGTYEHPQRHSAFLKVCGHVLAKSEGLEIGVLRELCVTWVFDHCLDNDPAHPLAPRKEWERIFNDIARAERNG